MADDCVWVSEEATYKVAEGLGKLRLVRLCRRLCPRAHDLRLREAAARVQRRLRGRRRDRRVEAERVRLERLGLCQREALGHRRTLPVAVQGQLHIARHNEALQEALRKRHGVVALARGEQLVRAGKPAVALDLLERRALAWIGVHHAAEER